MVKASNPILSGFYPDPSVCRVGEEYYLVNSSFAYFPGVPIFKSKDLAHWKQIGNILDRNSQIPMKGCGHSEGIYAPTIRYYGGIYYMITTNVSGGGNFVVTAQKPEGPWSEPYYLGEEEAPGIDPSLFFDEDGTCYYVGTRPNPEGVTYNGDWEVWVQKLDIVTMKLTGESTKIWKGAMKDVIWPEGPHIYKKDDWYYVMHAEGGTGPDHCIAVARSRQITGPYIGNPCNPILTHRHFGKDYGIRYVGHGDLVETPAGKWYMVMLASRPCDRYTNMGRETFLAEVTWEEEWPVVNPGIGQLTKELEIDLDPDYMEPEDNVYHFYKSELDYRLVLLRNPQENLYSLTEKSGYLRLFLDKATLAECDSPAYIGTRQCHFDYMASTMLEFYPRAENEAAGLAIVQNNAFHVQFVYGRNEKKNCKKVSLIFHRNGNREVLMEEDLSITDYSNIGGRIFMKIVCHGQKTWYYYSNDDTKYTLLMGEVDIKDLSTEVAGGFVGCTVGMYASANGKNEVEMNYADFGWLSYKEL